MARETSGRDATSGGSLYDMTLPLAIFRVDASVTQGLGHFMRCRALADEWRKRGGQVTFVTTETPSALLEHLRAEGYAVRDGSSNGLSGVDNIAWMTTILTEERPAVLVLDGYRFDVRYQQNVRPLVRTLVGLDDVPQRRFECDLVLNQNLGVAAEDYRPLVPPGSTLLLGPRYALLRSGFKEHAGCYRAPARPARALVTLGGGDLANHTASVLRELVMLPGLHLDVVLGSFYPHPDPLTGMENLNPGRVQVYKGLDNLLDLARCTDLAVTAAGSTVWELACLGIPMVVVGTADNQEAVLRGLREEEAAIVLGRMESIKSGEIAKAVSKLLAAPARLEALSCAAGRLVDGRGVERVVETIVERLAQSAPNTGASVVVRR